jgi:hypothetical protein
VNLCHERAWSGKLYLNDTGLDRYEEIWVRDGRMDKKKLQLKKSVPRETLQRLMQDTGDVRCGLDNRLLCITLPAFYFVLPQAREEVTVFVGAAYLSVLGTLPCLNSALRGLRYMGMEDYNNFVPAIAPADRAGCPTTIGAPDPEFINITVRDRAFSGCVETFEKSHSVLLNVSVDSVQQSLVIRTPEEVEAVEGLPYVFSSFKCNEVAVDPTARCAAIQVLSRDNGDLTLLTRFFRLQIQVKFGSLSFPESVRSDRALEFLKGSGKGDAVVQLYGKLCALNSALRTLSYIPNPDFNTIYNHVNRSWSPAANAEIIKARFLKSQYGRVCILST